MTRAELSRRRLGGTPHASACSSFSCPCYIEGREGALDFDESRNVKLPPIEEDDD